MCEHKMSRDEANKVWDILVQYAGAYNDENGYERDNFVLHHADIGCEEWRFQGNLGFGGKYYSVSNCVSCYSEDENKERHEIIKNTCKALCNIRATRINTLISEAV